jgi:hypothetical protein
MINPYHKQPRRLTKAHFYVWGVAKPASAPRFKLPLKVAQRLLADLHQPLRGPVTLDAKILEAERLEADLGALNQLRSLEQVLSEEAAAADLDLIRVQATEVQDGYRLKQQSFSPASGRFPRMI